MLWIVHKIHPIDVALFIFRDWMSICLDLRKNIETQRWEWVLITYPRQNIQNSNQQSKDISGWFLWKKFSMEIMINNIWNHSIAAININVCTSTILYTIVVWSTLSCSKIPRVLHCQVNKNLNKLLNVYICISVWSFVINKLLINEKKITMNHPLTKGTILVKIDKTFRYFMKKY